MENSKIKEAIVTIEKIMNGPHGTVAMKKKLENVLTLLQAHLPQTPIVGEKVKKTSNNVKTEIKKKATNLKLAYTNSDLISARNNDKIKYYSKPIQRLYSEIIDFLENGSNAKIDTECKNKLFNVITYLQSKSDYSGNVSLWSRENYDSGNYNEINIYLKSTKFKIVVTYREGGDSGISFDEEYYYSFDPYDDSFYSEPFNETKAGENERKLYDACEFIGYIFSYKNFSINSTLRRKHQNVTSQEDL